LACLITGHIVSCFSAILGTGCSIEGDVISCNSVVPTQSQAGGNSNIINGNVIANNTVYQAGSLNKIIGDAFSNSVVFAGGQRNDILGNVTNNTTGANTGLSCILAGGDFTNTTNITGMTSRTLFRSIILEDCTISGVSRRPFRCYSNSGTILTLISSDGTWQAPPSGASYVFEVTPNSYCDASYVNKLPLSYLDEMAFVAPASSTTLTVKIYPVGWTTSLDQDDVKLEVSYLDSASGITRTTVVNTSQTYANDGWRDVSVTFTPGQVGVVYFQLYFTAYESGDTVLVDPEWVIS
jgi:hypothetical protein